MTDEMGDLRPPLRFGPTVALKKGNVVSPTIWSVDDQRRWLEAATEAAFDQHVADSLARGRSITGRWSELTDEQRLAWRSIVTAAINRWTQEQEPRP